MRTLIIGGGLSGLALAEQLEAEGQDFLLLEARSRFGGRIKTAHHEGSDFDLGPAWFWAGQPRMAALIDRLGLKPFEQYSKGLLTVEDEAGRVHHGRGFASMQGSWRLAGGLGALTQALADRVSDARKRVSAPVTSLRHSADQIITTLENGEELRAKQVVLALPPRVAARIAFAPALPSATVQAMGAVPTWMAGQAKAIAVYDKPFWRDMGLSGDAMSRRGPMVELHDASSQDGGAYAIFGFIGIPADARRDTPGLRRAVQAQLVRLFGTDASAPAALFLKDWARDRYTATPADEMPLTAHPTYGLPGDLTGLWDGRLHFAGTEVAPGFGGFLEGALEAAENVRMILQEKDRTVGHVD